jgi:TPR repeat protein
MVRIAAALAALALSIAPAFADYQGGIDAFRNRDFATALKEWQPLAEAGHAGAQLGLAFMHGAGRGIPKNLEEAARWFARAAAQDHPLAQYNMGFIRERGEGVEQDIELAFEWYAKAAQQGLARAQRNLGVMYRDGRGVAVDLVAAYMWLELATRQKWPLSNQFKLALTNAMSEAEIAEATRRADAFEPVGVYNGE